MSDAIACPGCLKRFAWTPRVAGKRVTCHCGQKFITPDAPGGDVVPIYETRAQDETKRRAREAETYELADEPDVGTDEPTGPQPRTRSARHADATRCPDCNAPVKPTAVVCVRCGFDLSAGSKLQTEVADEVGADDEPAGIPSGVAADPMSLGTSPIARALANREDEVRLSRFREFFAPLAMVCLGFIGVVALSIYDTTSALEALGHFGLNTLFALLSVAAVLLAMTAGVGMLNLAFGELKSALLKVLGIGLLGSFAADTIMLLAMPLVLMLGVHGIIGIICFAAALNAFLVGGPLWALFDVDFHEAGLVTLGVFMLKAAGFILVLVMFGTAIT